MKSILNSIKSRLLLWTVLFTTTLLILFGVVIYQQVQKNIFLSVEIILHSKIQILKGLIFEKEGEITLEKAEVILGEYSIPRSGHYYQVLANGKIIAISPSLVVPEYNLASGELESSDEELKEKIFTSIGPADEPIMVIQHNFVIFDKPATIFAAQTLEDRIELLNRFKKFLLIIIFMTLIIVFSVNLWIAKHSLKPINRFSSKIETITHQTMSERLDIDLHAEEIKGVAKSFNTMIEGLEKAFDIEKRLIADASHELKTPLSVIRAQCDVLLQQDRKKEEYIDALNTIKAVSVSMKKMIDNMLSLTRLDAVGLLSSDFQTILVNNCLQDALNLAEVFAEKKNIKIHTTFTENLTILGNPHSLTEAFLNIIENAIRYNVNGGKVEVSTFKDDRNIKIMIKDTGIGIEEGELGKIFHRFYQVDTSRSSESTGLGLSIAKAIIEAHGGEIKVTSTINKGSCFLIILPLS
jgi:signal transduction histidine kinase